MTSTNVLLNNPVAPMLAAQTQLAPSAVAVKPVSAVMESLALTITSVKPEPTTAATTPFASTLPVLLIVFAMPVSPAMASAVSILTNVPMNPVPLTILPVLT